MFGFVYVVSLFAIHFPVIACFKFVVFVVHTRIFVCRYVCVFSLPQYVCVCVCVCMRERECEQSRDYAEDG